MYQITAIAFDCEIAYAESETFSYALEQILDDLSSVWHDADSTELLMLNPDGMKITAPLSLYR